MTIDEKLAQLGALWSFEVFDGHGLDLERARERLAQGIGQITRVAGATNLPPGQVTDFGNQIQRFLVEETRLGIPAILHEESLHGVMARDAICFPQSIGQAATWDPELVEEVARLIGRRLRAMGASQALAPVLDVARDPRWGRLEETYGEDPYLVAVLGCAYVRGIQTTAARRATRHRHGQAHGRARRAGRRPQHGTGAHRSARAARRLPGALRGRRA